MYSIATFMCFLRKKRYAISVVLVGNILVQDWSIQCLSLYMKAIMFLVSSFISLNKFPEQSFA